MSALLEESSISEASLAKCNTCKAAFSGIEKVKEHYKSDWHILNCKRRANNLTQLSKADYKIVTKTQTSKKSAPKIISKDFTLETVAEGSATANAGMDIEEEEMMEELPLGPNISIFDNKEFETVEECVEYMATTFGFFIPDQEFLVDLEGLLGYLGEKVKLGGLCLCCQRQCKPGRPCQNHMKDSSHCKIAFAEGVDMDEYEDFYDYTSSYEGMPEEEDGTVKTVEISSIGELVLLDGRVAGHRDYRLYYKQHFRPSESRPAVLALQREELYRLGAQFGGQKLGKEQMDAMDESQVMTHIVKYHKEVRKGQMMAQREYQRYVSYLQPSYYLFFIICYHAHSNTLLWLNF
jgi:pre-60S factor REI1